MALIVGAIVYGALYPGQKNQLAKSEILTEGYVAKGESLKFIQASPGTSVDYVVTNDSNAASAYLILTAHLPRETAPPSAGVFVPLNAPYEQAFASKKLRMTVRAKYVSDMPLNEFRMGYFTAGTGDSGWKVFPLTSEYEDYQFNFTPKASEAAPDLDYFGVWPDEEGESRKMAISEFRIEVLD